MNCADGPHHVGLVVLVITAHKALWFARCAMSYPAGTGPGKIKGVWLSQTPLDDLFNSSTGIGPPRQSSASSPRIVRYVKSS